MAHPFQKHREHRVSHARVKRVLNKADGGAIDNEIDISKPGPGQYPYGLDTAMSSEQSKNDSAERAEGKRFFDSGTRIPGRQKGLNDTYEKSLKRR
jgi:hypothetical protein